MSNPKSIYVASSRTYEWVKGRGLDVAVVGATLNRPGETHHSVRRERDALRKVVESRG